MELRLRRCRTSRDRLSSLPDELICEILSLLPTKDASLVSMSSRKMRTAFTLLTSLDFDDSPISYCAGCNPQFIHRFQYFKRFLDNVLQSSQSPKLSRFRLKFGGNWFIRMCHHYGHNTRHPLAGRDCGPLCFPDLDFAHLNAWIRFPLTRSGIRDIDLCIYVRNPPELNLPSAFFASETLELLRLDTNLDFSKQLSMSASFRLPNLKVLLRRSIVIPEDDFVDNLVSKCPSLEELYMNCWWKYGKSVTISSPSLRKLDLILHRSREQYETYCDFITIHTPNLRHLLHADLLAPRYSFATMNSLVEASFIMSKRLLTPEDCFRSMHSLAMVVSNVQHLSLLDSCLEALDVDELKNNQLPVFHNLTHLELGQNHINKWDTMLFAFLRCSPILETLEFPMGLVANGEPPLDHFHINQGEIERMTFRTSRVNPCCLKRIVIKECWGVEQEFELIRFLLENVSVLEELLVVCKQQKYIRTHKVDRALIETTLKKLPRASSTCLLIVQ